jgi:hypothetical protein
MIGLKCHQFDWWVMSQFLFHSFVWRVLNTDKEAMGGLSALFSSLWTVMERIQQMEIQALLLQANMVANQAQKNPWEKPVP